MRFAAGDLAGLLGWLPGTRALGPAGTEAATRLSVKPTAAIRARAQGVHRPHGGPGGVEDHRSVFQAQMVFWLTGATNGHAGNFSIFLHPAGGCALTPLCACSLHSRLEELARVRVRYRER